MRTYFGVILFLVGLATWAPVRAEQDHLTGYKVKDLDKIKPAGTYTFTDASGTQTCELKKAQFYLVQSEKNGGDDPRRGPAGRFACYKAKCSGALPADVTIDEQLANPHTLRPTKTQLVCVPAAPDCPVVVGGFCWTLGAAGANCEAACATIGRVYSPGTATYAGSDGSDAQCLTVLDALGAPAGALTSYSCAPYNVGCGVNSSGRFRCTNATDAVSSYPGDARACACQ